MSKVTICICVYNGEKYIIETLESVMMQTSKEFDLLIVNDCSTDQGIGMASKYLSENAWFNWEIYSFDENGGLAKARYFAERYIKSKYILFLDADDLMKPQMVEKLLLKIESDSDLIAVGSYLEYIDEDGKHLKGGVYVGAKTKEEFYACAQKKKLVFMPSSAIFDREQALLVGGHNVYGFPDGKPYYQDMCEDCDLWTRMSDLYIYQKAIIVLPEVLCSYRKMNNTMSTDTFAMKLRMRHIKCNLLLRRKGESEISFIDFMNNLQETELKKIKRECHATDSFRRFAFAVNDKKYLKGIVWLIIAIISSPKYVYKKAKPYIKK